MLFSLFYSLSPNYSIIKTFLFSTNLIAVALPFLTKSFDIQKTLKYFVLVICGLSVSYYLFNADIQLKLIQSNIINYDQLEGFGLSLGELIGCAIFILFFYKINNRVLFLSFFIWTIFSTGARGPILFLFGGLFFLGILFLYQSITKKTSFVYNRFVELGKEIAQAKYQLIFPNLLLIILLITSPRVNQMYYRTFWRLGLLSEYENNNVEVEADFNEDKINEKINEGFKKNAASKSTKSIKSNKEIGFISELTNILGSHKKSIGINKSMIEAELLEESKLPLDTNRSVSVRVKHFKFSKKAITASAKHLVFGYGIGSYGIIKTGIDGRNFPHNIFLETWVELGLIGIIILSAILFFCFNKLNNLNAGVYFALLFLLLNLMKSSSLVDMRIFWGLWATKILLDINTSQNKIEEYSVKANIV